MPKLNSAKAGIRTADLWVIGSKPDALISETTWLLCTKVGEFKCVKIIRGRASGKSLLVGPIMSHPGYQFNSLVEFFPVTLAKW